MAEIANAHALFAASAASSAHSGPAGRRASGFISTFPVAAPPRSLPPRERQSTAGIPPRPAPLRVLVVEDDPLVRQACAEIARDLGYVVDTADSVQGAQQALKRNAVDVLLLDLKLPGGGGFAVLEEVRESHPRTAAVVMTAFASVHSAVEAMRTGAGDYLAKPFSLEELATVLERAAERRNAFAENRDLRDRLHAGKASSLLMGQDPAMEKLFRILSKVAFTNHPVLILGEGGTGKEIVARAIHTNGPLAARPFLPVDCGSLMPSLIDGELFGTAPGGGMVSAAPSGSFVGREVKHGLLSTVDGGTVFLDEIGDLTPELQARLMRALGEREVRSTGHGPAAPLRARILAATNRDLTAMVESGRFRKDLYYRLNVVNIRIPPLRERPCDIPLLAAHLLDRFSEEHGTRYSLSDEALRLMVEYDWPGNVRELEHAMERACSLSSGPVLHAADLPAPLQERRYQARLPPLEHRPLPADGAEAVVTIMELERQAILRALHHLKGDKLLAAKLLGIGKTTLYRKLKEYGLSDELL